jgi:hypothetical protein
MNHQVFPLHGTGKGLPISRMLIVLGFLLIGLLLLAGCQGNSEAPPPAVPGISVEITADNCPNAIIAPNQQLTWINKDSKDHTVLDVTGNGSVLFDADTLREGDSFSYTFINPGAYEYACTKDGNMRGQITVE